MTRLALEVLAAAGRGEAVDLRGADQRRERLERFRQARLGVLMNQASTDRNFVRTHEALLECGFGSIRAMFSPQHGFWSDAEANMVESPDIKDPVTGTPVYSLYSETRRPTDAMLEGLDCLLVDLQDVGTRVYTFAWTVLECLHACAENGIAVLLLDRPNPIGGRWVEGPALHAPFRSFVGGACVPMRHGLTLGELCLLAMAEHQIDVEFWVLPVSDWDLELFDNSRAWAPTSPNLPRVESLLSYPGQVLMEGVTLSEGRGTTTPFECVGAPFIEPAGLQNALNARGLPGVRFLANRFVPSFDKWRGESCGGVSIHVRDRNTYRPYRTAVEMLFAIRELYPEQFHLVRPPYEYEASKPPLDIISGSDRLRQSLDEGDIRAEVVSVDLSQWREQAAAHLLYEDPDRFRTGSSHGDAELS